ncbi:MAG TPA: MaoC family dehydratase [Paraburkholderia sp.]|uniref:MaoC family dehydratase n=1 Tax=Paraburkholderia sp. TaxID=1926495 RepID=UPI002B4A73E7|nr:MaoC family dehydratase [Paraburkholderia sp.]HKR44093.1 MaoC family dehydratase [Paraburkholderia sp.]
MREKPAMAGLYFEQFEVGQQFNHDVRRTVTETDNVLFSSMTLNPAAIHLDREYANGTEFGRPLMNSAFTLGLMVGISVGDTTLGTTVGNLGWDEVRFPKPLFEGDTIRVETSVLEKRASKSRPDNGIVVFLHTAINQRGEVVASCKRSALMYCLSAKK